MASFFVRCGVVPCLAILALLGQRQAMAATMTYGPTLHDNGGAGFSNGATGSFALPKFDDLGGARPLTKVTLTVTIDGTGGRHELDNESAAGATVTLGIGCTIRVKGPLGGTQLVVVPDAFATVTGPVSADSEPGGAGPDFAGTDYLSIIGGPVSDTRSAFRTSSTSLAPYLGMGNVTFTFDSAGTSTSGTGVLPSPGARRVTTATTKFTFTTRLDYEYTPPPPADYGDAPDGILACEGTPFCTVLANYPTLLGTANTIAGRTGPYHTDFSDVWLGPQGNTETAEAAPFQPCCSWLTPPPDADNGPIVLCLDALCTTGVLSVPTLVPGGNWEEVSIPFGTTPTGFGFWIYEVSVGAGAPATPRFANVVVDWTLNGRYGDVPGEWVVVDQPIPAAPGGTAVMVTGLFPTPAVIPNPLSPLGWAIEPFWTRFTVSRSPVAPAFPGGTWDGSGPLAGYVWGETEDFVPWTDPPAHARFPDCDDNHVPDIVDVLMNRLPDPNGNRVPEPCDHPILVSVSEAIPGNMQFTLAPLGETVHVNIPTDMNAVEKKAHLVSSLTAAQPQYYAAGAGAESLSLNGFRPGTRLQLSTGGTAEVADRLATASAQTARVAYSSIVPFEPFDRHGQPAVFTAGIVTDVGELTVQVSAQELNFQTDGPIICQALFQRLAPRAPQYGGQINYAGDRLEVYFDPAYTVTQGGVVFGTSSRTEGCSGEVVIPCTPADLDCDGDVDLGDFNLFRTCATGPAVPYIPPGNLPPGCLLPLGPGGRIVADFDRDGDVDSVDFGRFQANR